MRPFPSASLATLTRWALAAGLLGAACRDAPDHGSAPPADLPADADLSDDSDQPIRFSYVCGNRFLVANAYSVPVTVTWRVIGTDEAGSVTVPAAPNEDPSVTEAQVETRSSGPVELSLDGHKVRTRANGAVPCTSDASVSTLATVGAGGSWSAPFRWPIVAVHQHLMPNGKVLSWGEGGHPQVWDPVTRTFAEYRSPIPLFCTGHAFTTDGRLVVFGGHMKKEHGFPNITLFSTSGGWSSSTPMQRGRWYPTATTMSRGEIVAISGKDQNGVIVPVPEVWTNGVVRRLTTAGLTQPYYPIAFLEPREGRLFYAGEQRTTRFLDISGTGKWTTVGQRRFGTRDYGSAVMYDVGKVLYAGGGRTTNTAETIDLGKAAPVWKWTGSMARPRRHLTTTVLPTGEVLATSGTGDTAFNDLTKVVRAAEIWSPKTGVWTTHSSAQIPRGYHSTALLLPDARVLVAGGGDATATPDQKNAEIFSPPYLFRGTRPRISSAPSVIRYGQAFEVNTPDASSIANVSLIRLGSVTHGFDMNQRFQALAFTRAGTELTMTVANRKQTPPGHYMLFLLNGAGVPSVAKILQIH